MKSNSNGWKKVRRVFRLPASRQQIDRELRDEFRFHIEGRIEGLMEAGMSRTNAEREVHEKFGNYNTYWQSTREIDEDIMRQNRRFEMASMLWNELQHSARVLLRTPAFSLIALITLALGIGATTAIYTVLDAVVLRPLPYRNSEQLVSVLHPATVPGSGERKWGMSAGGYFYLKDNNKTLSDLGLYTTADFTVTNGGKADVARVGRVTASIFTTLEARPEFGRLILPSDDKPGPSPVVVLSHEFFQRRFGGDTTILHRNLETSGGSFEIVGVAEPGLTLPMPGPFASQSNLAGFGVDVWMPMQLNPAGPFYNNHPNVGIGRLRNGVRVDSAQKEFTKLSANFTDVMPSVYNRGFITQYNFRTEVSGLRNAVLGPTIPRALWMVLASVVLVLLIAVANVANLFIVRMEARRRESAIRAALGASSGHMTAHYLSESLLLCGAAAVLGTGLAYAGLKGLLSIAPASIPRLASVTLSVSSIAVAFAIASLLALLLGLMPLVRKIDINTLREGGRGLSSSPRQRAVRSGLVISQIALALVLLASASLMTRSFMHLRDVKPGFEPGNVFAFDLSLPFTEFDTREKALIFHEELQRKISEIPGVAAVGSIDELPLEGFGTGCTVVFREQEPYGADEKTPCVSAPTTAPGFFEALKIPVRGRAPSWNDVNTRSQAVVITKALADRIWPGKDPIGKGIGSNGQDSQAWYRVVGVVDNFRAEALESAPTEAVFYAATSLRPNRRDGSVNDLIYLVRTNSTAPPSLMKQINEIVVRMNPRIPVVNARTMNQVVERSMSRTTFIMTLLAVAAIVALALSAVGMYGVISYVVAQRRSEIGIRIALGAGLTNVARLIVLQSVRLAAIGVAVGVAIAYGLGKTMTSLLFGVSANDPGILIGASLLLVLIATMASLVPARRAARIDPLEAMRSD